MTATATSPVVNETARAERAAEHTTLSSAPPANPTAVDPITERERRTRG